MRPSASAVRFAGAVLTVSTLHAQSGQRPAADPRPIFRASTRLIEITVVVQDSDRQPVAGLARDDFKVYDNGKEQKIELFSVQSDQSSSRTVATDPTPPGVFSNHVDARSLGSVTVILLDRVNSSGLDQTYARNEVLKFLGQIRPDDHVALYVLDPDGVRIVHDFTSDTSALVRALARHRSRPNDPDAAGSIGPETGDPEIDGVLSGIFLKLDAAITESRVQTTLRALEAIAHHLSAVQGRKNLIWVSSGFPVLSQDGKGGPLTFSKRINEATRAVNDANIAIYPVDDRGLIPGYLGTIAATATRVAGASLLAANDRDILATNLTVDSMHVLASDTGGRAFTNTNDISAAVRRAVDDSRIAYVLGYYPDHEKWDNRFREIKVKVNRPGVSVRHRSGYVAAAPMQGDQRRREDALLQLARSPLAATGIGLMAQIEPAGAHAGDLAVTIRVDPRTVTLQRTGETWTGVLDVLIVQARRDGTIGKSFGGAVGLTFADGRRDIFMTEGLTLTRTVALQPDAAQVRVLVRDAPSGTTGSVIVPVAKLARP